MLRYWIPRKLRQLRHSLLNWFTDWIIWFGVLSALNAGAMILAFALHH